MKSANQIADEIHKRAIYGMAWIDTAKLAAIVGEVQREAFERGEAQGATITRRQALLEVRGAVDALATDASDGNR